MKMRAAVVEEFKQQLVIKEVPDPTLRSPFDAIIRVHASGVCHTDLHAANGDWPVRPKLPFIPGHEGVGVVESVGELVTNIKVGDRVGIPWLHTACGQCEYCLTGWETLCGSQQNTGYSVDGGYAELVAADARYVGKVPDGLQFADVAPHFCAGVTTYKAIKVAESGPGKTVMISGIGGLGHMALQYAKVTGARTIAVDVTEEKLELARSLGADEVVNATAVNVADAVQKMGGADIVIGTAVSAKSFRSAFDALKPHGRLVLVGLPPEELPIPVFDLVLKGVSVIGSIVGTRKDLQEALDLAARGLVTCDYKTARLEDINAVFREMKAGTIKGRVVLKMA
jgi:alcohol dehydrogenase, propanol-preferring